MVSVVVIRCGAGRMRRRDRGSKINKPRAATTSLTLHHCPELHLRRLNHHRQPPPSATSPLSLAPSPSLRPRSFPQLTSYLVPPAITTTILLTIPHPPSLLIFLISLVTRGLLLPFRFSHTPHVKHQFRISDSAALPTVAPSRTCGAPPWL